MRLCGRKRTSVTLGQNPFFRPSVNSDGSRVKGEGEDWLSTLLFPDISYSQCRSHTLVVNRACTVQVKRTDSAVGMGLRPSRYSMDVFHFSARRGQAEREPLPLYFVGTRRFSSSNQLRTTWICGAVGVPDSVCPAGIRPTNLPPGVMS